MEGLGFWCTVLVLVQSILSYSTLSYFCWLAESSTCDDDDADNYYWIQAIAKWQLYYYTWMWATKRQFNACRGCCFSDCDPVSGIKDIDQYCFCWFNRLIEQCRKKTHLDTASRKSITHLHILKTCLVFILFLVIIIFHFFIQTNEFSEFTVCTFHRALFANVGLLFVIYQIPVHCTDDWSSTL